MKKTLIFLSLLVFTGCQSQTPRNVNSANNSGSDPQKVVTQIVDSIKSLEKQGREMEQLRAKDDLESMGNCATIMKRHGETVAELQKKSKSLPNNYRIFLVPALTEVEVCASCSTGALGACDNVKKSLEDLQKATAGENKQ